MVHSRDVVLILMLATATGACAQPDDAAQNGSAPGAAEQATPQDAPVVVSDTPEDSLIFERTVAWVRESRSDTLPIGELIAAIGQRFVGAPYTPGLLEVPETEQLVVNLREFDCVTYVEHMLSMARAIAAGEPTYGRFKDELRRIRYRDGELTGYPSRLHYFSEWISNNDDKGVVENITQALGGVRDTTGIDFMSRHTESYRQLADSVNLQAGAVVVPALHDPGEPHRGRRGPDPQWRRDRGDEHGARSRHRAHGAGALGGRAAAPDACAAGRQHGRDQRGAAGRADPAHRGAGRDHGRAAAAAAGRRSLAAGRERIGSGPEEWLG